MSKHETWRTEKYWKTVGGKLIKEFYAICQSKENGKRIIDGLIILNEPNSISKKHYEDVEGKDIVIIQTKGNRLGMYLMGQAFFSREIMKRFKPKSIRTVAICGKDDEEMRKLCEKFDIEVFVVEN